MASSSHEILTKLQPALAELAADLLERARDERVGRALQATWRREREEQRTADTFDVWSRERVKQVAAAWVLSLVFVRTLEDRDLVERRRIAGPGAEDSEQLFVQLAPYLTARDYLFTVFRELSRLEGAKAIFEPAHNPVWLLGPSDPAARKLIDIFRRKTADGELDLHFEGSDTRFLGDLYQDLDAESRERYALLQTPEFVESFILDGTLDPAIRELGVENVSLIDPAGGSGHFVLGAFARLLAAWRQACPAEDARELARRALSQVFAVDINPFAVAIARFRLTLAFMEAAGNRRLKDVPLLPLRLVVADSLIKQRRLAVVRGEVGSSFVLEEEREATEVLRGGHYSVVVGNPPYINVKDAALRERYRREYDSCHGKYQLVAPFLERFIELAAPGGYVGTIVGNGFMKREFGTKLVEQVLPRAELTEVVDTQGAYIPGHGTPTVILFARNRRPAKTPVLAVMGKRGEPSTPADPSQGKVWSSIRIHHREVGYEDEFISVAELERERLARHPWSLGGGGAAELRVALERSAPMSLGEIAESIGITSVTGEDSVYVVPNGSENRLRLQRTRPLVIGEHLRDWQLSVDISTLWPYDLGLRLLPLAELPDIARYLFPFRAVISQRRRFGVPMLERGLTWYELQELYADKLRTPLSIAFAFVATHNHFVLDRGGKVFKQSAPVIKLKKGASEDEHLALLGYLNSSTACFWMKQVMMNKGATSDTGVLQADPEKFRFEFDSTKLGKLPVPVLPGGYREPLLALARALDAGGTRLAEPVFSAAIVEYAERGAASLQGTLDRLEAGRDALRRSMASWQEELDWLVYEVAGLVSASSACRSRALSVTPEQIAAVDPANRPYRLLESTGGLRPSAVEQARLALIMESREIGLIERPEYKRRWFRSQGAFDADNVSDAVLRREALRTSLLERMEQGCRDNGPQGGPVTVRSLAAALEHNLAVNTVAELFTGDQSPNLERLFVDLIGEESVPYLASFRHTDSGLEKRAAWENAWDLQRREDAGEKIEVPVPPRYTQTDFRSGVIWRHRGKLDVPKERFISYPEASGDEDKSPLVGWAGWNHLEQAQALTALYRQRAQEGWERDRLLPLLAGVVELLPWLQQWHNEPDPQLGGTRAGDAYASFLTSEARKHGVTLDDLKAWRPATATRGRKARSAEESEQDAIPDAVYQAVPIVVQVLDKGSGAELRDMCAVLSGVNAKVVARAVDELVASGRLTQVGRRPKKFRIVVEG